MKVVLHYRRIDTPANSHPDHFVLTSRYEQRVWRRKSTRWQIANYHSISLFEQDA